MSTAEPLLKVEQLKKHFTSRKQFLGAPPKTCLLYTSWDLYVIPG